MIVDAHHHLWDPGARRHAWLDPLPQLRRPFGIREFGQLTAQHAVTASVLVQVLASAAETEEFLALAGRTPLLAGVVGWADLTAPGIGDELARLGQFPGGDHLVGIRHLIQGEPDPDWLGRTDVRRGLRAVRDAGLAYDLLIRPGQLPAAIAVAQDLGDVRFVLDHGAKPDIAHGQREPWSTLIGQLAAAPNVSCKVSGLVTRGRPRLGACPDHPLRGAAAGLLRARQADVRLGLAGVHAGRGLRRRYCGWPSPRWPDGSARPS